MEVREILDTAMFDRAQLVASIRSQGDLQVALESSRQREHYWAAAASSKNEEAVGIAWAAQRRDAERVREIEALRQSLVVAQQEKEAVMQKERETDEARVKWRTHADGRDRDAIKLTKTLAKRDAQLAEKTVEEARAGGERGYLQDLANTRDRENRQLATILTHQNSQLRGKSSGSGIDKE